MKHTSVRVRIAPSPTGYPHIGTIYQALFDYAYAKKTGGSFIVRIEDTDQERFVSDAEEKLFLAFDWFGLVEDESPRRGGEYAPYRQSERLELYKKYAKELIENGHAYYCFCSRERLEAVRAEMMRLKQQPMYDKHCRNLSAEEVEKKLSENTMYVIRMKIPEATDITFRDEIRGQITYQSAGVDDQVIIKSDGFPTYHLAVVVDDHLMKITHIVRGEEWLPSTPKHILLYQYFNWEIPYIYHTSALRNPDKSKLSKRQGHTNVIWYQEEGYLPQAILNYIALLGWSHPEEKELFSLNEFIDTFDLKDMSAVGPVFDLTKLTWMNQQHLIKMSVADLQTILQTFYKGDNEVQDVLSQKCSDILVTLSQTRMKTLKDFKELVVHTADISLTSVEKETGKKFIQIIEDIDSWNKESILEVLKAFIKNEGIKWQLLYLLITGRPQGLPLADLIELEGKERIIKRVLALVS